MLDVTHVVDTRPADHGLGATLARGVAWGASGGAASGALFVVPLLIWNGPVEALLIYPPMAAVPGAVVGIVVGLVTAVVLASTRPATVTRAREIGALVPLLAVGWLVFVLPLFGAWALVLAVTSGALLGPRVSARPTDAAAAGGTASPGSSPAPGR